MLKIHVTTISSPNGFVMAINNIPSTLDSTNNPAMSNNNPNKVNPMYFTSITPLTHSITAVLTI